MRLDQLIKKEEYINLEKYIKVLLNNITFAFGQNLPELIVFLSYLLINVKYKSIKNIDKRLLLLMHDTDKFWLDDENVKRNTADPLRELIQDIIKNNVLKYLRLGESVKNNAEDPLRELKQKIVKVSVLNYLQLVVKNSKYKDNINILKFIDEKIDEMEKYLDDKNIDITDVFNQNMIFLEKRELGTLYSIRTDIKFTILAIKLGLGLLNTIVTMANLPFAYVMWYFYKGQTLEEMIDSISE